MLTSRLVEWLWASWWVARRRSRLGNEFTCGSESLLAAWPSERTASQMHCLLTNHSVNHQIFSPTQQEPAGRLHPDRHHQHPVCVRRRLCGPRPTGALRCAAPGRAGHAVVVLCMLCCDFASLMRGCSMCKKPTMCCPCLLLPLVQQVAERIASSSIGFGNPVRARGTPGTIAAQSAALRQARGAVRYCSAAHVLVASVSVCGGCASTRCS